MNILIVADKSNIKTYESAAKSAPNTSVLGAVTSVNSNFVSELKDKWHPHMVIIDTDVQTKKINITDVINNIKTLYPYIKTVVLTDDEDINSYPAYAVIRGQVSSIQFKELIKNAIADVNNELYDSEIAEKLTHKSKNNTNYLKTVLDNTVRLSNKNEYTDKLSTAVPQTKVSKTRKKHGTRNRLICIACISLSSLIVIILVCIVLKSCNSVHSSATADEATTQSTYFNEYDENPSEEKTTESELSVSFTDPPLTEAAVINDHNVSSVSTVPHSNSENSSSSSSKAAKNNTISNNSSASRNSNSDNSSDKTVNNSQSNNKTESVNNNYSNQGSASVSQNNNKFNNNNTNSVQSIKLSYSQKTLTVGEYITISATVSPVSDNYTVNYSSSNTSVCTVNSSGTVTAKKSGTATVTATAGGKSASCKIIVNSAPTIKPTSPPTTADPVKLSYTNYTIVSGQIFTLKLYNASSVSWSINYPSIITTIGGSATQITIKGLKSGTATVTATNNATGKSYRCNITVK